MLMLYHLYWWHCELSDEKQGHSQAMKPKSIQATSFFHAQSSTYNINPMHLAEIFIVSSAGFSYHRIYTVRLCHQFSLFDK